MKQSGKKKPVNKDKLDNDDLRLLFNLVDVELEEVTRLEKVTGDILIYRKRLQGILNKIGVQLNWWRP